MKDGARRDLACEWARSSRKNVAHERACVSSSVIPNRCSRLAYFQSLLFSQAQQGESLGTAVADVFFWWEQSSSLPASRTSPFQQAPGNEPSLAPLGLLLVLMPHAIAADAAPITDLLPSVDPLFRCGIPCRSFLRRGLPVRSQLEEGHERFIAIALRGFLGPAFASLWFGRFAAAGSMYLLGTLDAAVDAPLVL